ncbi:MAG: hypothetical protein AAF664_22510, partial [Planctomycetota bacterium]
MLRSTFLFCVLTSCISLQVKAQFDVPRSGVSSPRPAIPAANSQSARGSVSIGSNRSGVATNLKLAERTELLESGKFPERSQIIQSVPVAKSTMTPMGIESIYTDYRTQSVSINDDLKKLESEEDDQKWSKIQTITAMRHAVLMQALDQTKEDDEATQKVLAMLRD